jgi:predicted phosphohydrolase
MTTNKIFNNLPVKRYSITRPYKLQYISDLHLEYLKEIPKIKPAADELALLGDIGNPFKQNYYEMLTYASYNWNKVYLITGNHEYWQDDKTMDEVDDHIDNLVSNHKNIYFLNNRCHIANPEYTILGTSLWSNIYNEPKKLFGDDISILVQNHDNTTRYINWNDINGLFYNNKKWLSDQLAMIKNTNKDIDNNKRNKQIKCIVLSHHLPSYQLIHKKFMKSPYQDRFASNLDDLIADPVAAWLCGHSHITMNININNIPCAINAYGYSKQNPNRTQENINQVLILQE